MFKEVTELQSLKAIIDFRLIVFLNSLLCNPETYCTMKHYFKYSSGYVNIDADNLFLTNSGNWQETRELEEKSNATKRQNSLRIARMNIFVYVVFGIIGFIIYKTLSGNKPYFKLIFGLPVVAYFVNNYFKSETGKRYKIPLSKIKSVENYNMDGLKIYFLNAANEDDFEIIEHIENKGFKILEDLNLLKKL